MSTQAEGDPAAWGRVADDGTVYVRTAAGERPIGSWQAGDAAAALSFFALRYEDLLAEVRLLETRLDSGKSDASHTLASVQRLQGALPEAKVIGDLGALETQLAGLATRCEARLEEDRAAKTAKAAENVELKRQLAAEAETLADSTQWKKSGDRLRDIVSSWREIRIDRRTDNELWTRVRRARAKFAERRTAYFAAVAEERQAAKAHKQKLLAEARTLSESSDWRPTAARMKALMREWKTVGRADRDADAQLWTEFRAAQDAFFTRLSALDAERAEDERKNQTAREALLTEAEAIDLAADLAAAQEKLRSIQERWEKVGRGPRETTAQLDERLARVARSVRDAVDAQWREASVESSPLVIRLRESVTKLEARAARARAAGKEDEAREAEAALTTQREWLAQAEHPGST